jgi:hypothetical protein
VTEAGRHELESWLREPTSESFHIRSFAFLKLYFGYFAGPEDVLNLAGAQTAALEAQLRDIAQMIDRLKVREDRKCQLALGEMFADLSRAVFDRWKRIETRAARESRRQTRARSHARSRRQSA